MAKTKVALRYSAKLKFKSSEEIELIITDGDTHEIFALCWNFKKDACPAVVKHDESGVLVGEEEITHD